MVTKSKPVATGESSLSRPSYHLYQVDIPDRNTLRMYAHPPIHTRYEGITYNQTLFHARDVVLLHA